MTDSIVSPESIEKRVALGPLNRWWPIAGGVYIMQAIKRQHGMRLVMPKWRDRMARAKALALMPQKPLAHKNDCVDHQ